jgi:hypothetical protein
MDNLDPVVDNQDPVVSAEPITPVTTAEPESFSWKSKLNSDMQKSPTLQKFPDDADGLVKAVDAHLNLERLLGHEKVPIPKGDNDVEGWARYSKAMGIPDKADGYALADVDIPAPLKGITFDKKSFAEIAHAHKLTPKQTEGLWNKYTSSAKEAYGSALAKRNEELTGIKNALMAEWGDAYETRVGLGQTLIDKFATDEQDKDYLTASLTKDMRLVRFLANIGVNFAENKIGEFKHQRFSFTPEEAQTEISKILSDETHPYLNEKAPIEEHTKAVEYVNSLYAVVNRAKRQAGQPL